eukprot:8824638-Alexandrium_andersonii.AAC.1
MGKPWCLNRARSQNERCVRACNAGSLPRSWSHQQGSEGRSWVWGKGGCEQPLGNVRGKRRYYGICPPI